MKRSRIVGMFWVTALVRTVVIVRLLVACIPPDKHTVAADKYEDQQMGCVEQYADKPSIDRCRAKVKLAWMTDAGVADAAADADGGK